METALSKFTHRPQPLRLSLHHYRPSISRPISSLSFRIPLTPNYPYPQLSVKASSSSSSHLSSSRLQNPKPPIIQTLNPYPFSLLRTTLVAAVTATALFFARFNLKPLIAAPISPPSTVEESISDGEKEMNLEEFLISHPDDVQALRDLMELKIKSKKVQEAVQIIDQLIKLEPEDSEWPLLKSHMYCYSGDTESAKNATEVENFTLPNMPIR